MQSVANEAAYQYISINISLSKFNLKLESPVAILVVPAHLSSTKVGTNRFEPIAVKGAT